MKDFSTGDIVEVWQVTRWGGKIPTNQIGLIIRRQCLKYDNDLSTWQVLVNGNIKLIQGRKLKKVEVVKEDADY